MAGNDVNDLVRIETNILPKSKLIVVFCGLAFALLISFIDQNSIGIALPTIGADINAATTISWYGQCAARNLMFTGSRVSETGLKIKPTRLLRSDSIPRVLSFAARTYANWKNRAGTSSLIANTVFQVLYGRLSDIVGRKVVFLSAVGLLALGDLLCSFAKTGPQLYAFRGISGVGKQFLGEFKKLKPVGHARAGRFWD